MNKYGDKAFHDTYMSEGGRDSSGHYIVKDHQLVIAQKKFPMLAG
jgi:hypothetical protein